MATYNSVMCGKQIIIHVEECLQGAVYPTLFLVFEIWVGILLKELFSIYKIGVGISLKSA